MAHIRILHLLVGKSEMDPRNLLLFGLIQFFSAVHSNEEASFQPPYIVCISVIIHVTDKSKLVLDFVEDIL